MITPGTMRKVRDLLTRLADGTGVDLGLLYQYRMDAARLLPLVQERKAPAKTLPGEGIKAKRERKRRTHREETATIYEAVSKRAEGKCESCGQPESATFGKRLEMHHVLGGVGRRRQKQAVETCMMVCRFCHGMFNGHPYGACNVVAWAEKYGYPVPPRIRELADSILPEAAHRASRRSAP